VESESTRLIGVLLSERYRIEAKIGTGGMSTVYLATDETLDRPVAVKLLHSEISGEVEQLERFRREAKSAARLSHPNLVSVIDAGDEEGRPFIVFEYIQGETLKTRLEAEGPLPVDEAVAYAIEIARGLQAAHARKLVHRDIKPQNVLIDGEGHAKVTDFGIARSLEAKGLTDTGRVMGTTDYVSPEQAMGEIVDERSDLYSLGVVLFEMLTGEVPFEAETQVAVAMKHVNEPLPDVFELRPGIPAAVAAVIDKATSKDPKRRYDSIAEMVADLESCLEVTAGRSRKPSGQATTVLGTVPRSRRPLTGGSGRRIWLALAALGAALLVAAVLIGGVGGGGGASSVRIIGATDYDPLGDGSEHPEERMQAIDGNPTGTAWSTETYSGPDFGTKPGTGIYVSAAEPVRATSLRLRLSESGADLEVYAASGSAPASLSGWRRVGAASGVGTDVDVPLDVPEPSDLYLVWFKQLPPADDGSGFRAEVTDIRLEG